MAQHLLNEWEMDGPSEQLGDVIRLMERLLDGGNRKQLLESLCHLLQQQVLGSRALIGVLNASRNHIDDWYGPHLPLDLLLDLDDYPLAAGSPWRQRLEAGHMLANGDLQQDASWGQLGDAVNNADLRAGLLLPVTSKEGLPLALLGLFWPNPHLALPREQLALKRATRLARIGLEYLHRQQLLQQDEATYRQLAETTNVPMLVLKGEIIAYANPAFVRLAGNAAAMQPDTSLQTLIHVDDQQLARAALLQAQRQRLPGSFSFRLQQSDGTSAQVAADISPMSFQGSPAVLATLNPI